MTDAARELQRILNRNPDLRVDDEAATDIMTGVSRRVGYDATKAVRATASEFDEQVALFEWAEVRATQVEELELLYAIPNGGHRHRVVGARLKASGLKAGYPDIGLDVARGPYHGLRIELKTDGGRVRDNQSWWLDRLQREGYFVAVCWGFHEAKETIESYLSMEDANG